MTPGLCECGCGHRTTLIKYNDRNRGLVAGTFRRYVRGHATTGKHWQHLAEVKAYRWVHHDRKPRLLHRLRAERALGKPLPAKAVVHHADGSKRDDAPLVICQDTSYHRLLHSRMRVKALGGNPWTDLYCPWCNTVKHADQFYNNRSSATGHHYHCKACSAETQRRDAPKKAARYAARRAS